MKKTRLFIRMWLPAVLALSMCSCNREAGNPDVLPSGVARVPLTLEAYTDGSGSKTVLDFPSAKWEDSDEIAVFNGVFRKETSDYLKALALFSALGL